jgi:hypothetical protein
MKLAPKLFVLASALLALPGMARAESQAALFPFVLPWNDASPGITDWSGRLRGPAGRSGHIRAGGDGHLHAGAQRIRFCGVDIAFGPTALNSGKAGPIACTIELSTFRIVNRRSGLFAGFHPESLAQLGTASIP